MVFRFAVPHGKKALLRIGKPHTFKPDVDNLTKLVLDVVKDAGALTGDDCLFAFVTALKVWCKPGSEGVTAIFAPLNIAAFALAMAA